VPIWARFLCWSAGEGWGGSPTVGRVFRVAGQWAAGKARWGGNLARHENVPTYERVFVSGWREGFGRPPPNMKNMPQQARFSCWTSRTRKTSLARFLCSATRKGLGDPPTGAFFVSEGLGC